MLLLLQLFFVAAAVVNVNVRSAAAVVVVTVAAAVAAIRVSAAAAFVDVHVVVAHVPFFAAKQFWRQMSVGRSVGRRPISPKTSARRKKFGVVKKQPYFYLLRRMRNPAP